MANLAALSAKRRRFFRYLRKTLGVVDIHPRPCAGYRSLKKWCYTKAIITIGDFCLWRTERCAKSPRQEFWGLSVAGTSVQGVACGL